MKDQITQNLAKLDDAKAGKEVYIKKKQDLMNGVITPEIKEMIKDIEAEFAPDIDHFDEVIKNLELEIKEAVVAHGESVKGEHIRASFVKGRVTWDSKGLEGYAVGNPEVLAFRKEGKPYASIKNV